MVDIIQTIAIITQTIFIGWAFFEGRKYLKKYANQLRLEEKIGTITETYRALFEFLAVTDDVLSLGSQEAYDKLKTPSLSNQELQAQLDIFLQRYQANSTTYKSQSRRLQGLIEANLVVIDKAELHVLWATVLENFKELLSPLIEYQNHRRYGGIALFDLNEIAQNIPNGAFSGHTMSQRFRGSISVLKAALSDHRKNINGLT
ncbi:hypothetical protein GCM10007049_19080 [Echinicola pacifica]|uniref:Uncharacterized protein n=1 Tax=Echinicola pacifica TaxID=346377 RepID=A0A918PZG9_9BACT|nr:hypothetical protein [Echinicola pacifica]GGZ26567.1 hypothetical protein GCM10007049_19080 [Echinicola pacifica]